MDCSEFCAFFWAFSRSPTIPPTDDRGVWLRDWVRMRYVGDSNVVFNHGRFNSARHAHVPYCAFSYFRRPLHVCKSVFCTQACLLRYTFTANEEWTINVQRALSIVKTTMVEDNI